jgi:NHLM bacteriocin system ABC transporter peptidase/ATP-binding protein
VANPPKRRKTPTVLQMEAVECGAAALAIILGYYQTYIPLEELRVECGVSRDGSKANNVLKAARKYGLNAKGYRKEPEALRALPGPMIVHWNFNHFLVLEGFKGDTVYLNDPAIGPRSVSYEEFDQSYTGIVLCFKPAPEYKKQGAKPGIARSLSKRLKGSETALLFVFLAGLFLVIPGLAIPAFTKVFIDNILLGHDMNWLLPLLGGLAITALLRAALTGLQRTYLLRLETKFSLSSSSAFFWHVLRLPIGFFSQRFSGDIGSRVMINDRVAQMLSGELAVAALNSLMIVFYLILMFQYSFLLTVISIVAALLNIVFLRYVSRKRVDGNMRLVQEEGKMQGVAMNGLQMIETLKSGGTESDFFAKWAGYQSKWLNTQQRLGVSSQALGAVPSLLAGVSSVLVLAAGGYEIMNGTMTIGMLVAFQSLMTSFMDPVRQMVQLGGTLQEAAGGLMRLDDVLNHEIGVFEEGKTALQVSQEQQGSLRPAAPQAKLSGNVELKGITFGYNKLEGPLIEDFNLNLKPGSRVALVGGSGSGKSTVAKLIAGMYEPWSGEILFDGMARRELSRNVMGHSLAVVDQDIHLFEGTIKENLSLWDATTPETDIIRAAKDACIDDEISARSGGYEHGLEEGGNNFSGGQRQRLEIARALSGNPSILVLDEATSALDPNTEQTIDENFRRRGCTCLIVAHRLSTIRDADEIILLQRGKVAERGTHHELMKLNGAYAKLIAEQ